MRRAAGGAGTNKGGAMIDPMTGLPHGYSAVPDAELAALRERAGRAAAAEAVLLAVVNRGHRARCPRTTAARGRVACRCGVDTVGDALAALRAGGAGETEG